MLLEILKLYSKFAPPPLENITKTKKIPLKINTFPEVE